MDLDDIDTMPEPEDGWGPRCPECNERDWYIRTDIDTLECTACGAEVGW